MSLEQFVRVYEIIEIKESILHDSPGLGAYETTELEKRSHGFYAHRGLASAKIEILKNKKIEENPALEYSDCWFGLLPPDVAYRITYIIEPQLIELEKVSEINILE